MPTQTPQQLANALNPTPSTIATAGDGQVFRNGAEGIYARQGKTMYVGTLSDIAAGIGKPGDKNAAIDYLKTNYGFDYNSLSEVSNSTLADYNSNTNGYRTVGLNNQGNINLNLLQYFKPQATPVQQIYQTVNTQQNSLATPEQYAASQAAQQQQLRGYAGNNVTLQNGQVSSTPLSNGQTGAAGGATSGISTPGAYGTPEGQPDLSGLPPEFQQLYGQLETYLADLQKRGQVLNPAIDLTPDKVAEFLNQAHTEIDPYYSSQLKLASDALASQMGYEQNQLQTNEQRLQTAYQDQLRGIGETAADQGFAQSGIRNKNERTLALDTNNTLTDARNAFSYNANNAARGFAQDYGTSNLPNLQIGEGPSVTAGEQNFTQSGRQLPLYSLSSSVYDGLVGKQQYQQNADITNRVSQLEGAFRSNQALAQQRQLQL